MARYFPNNYVEYETEIVVKGNKRYKYKLNIWEEAFDRFKNIETKRQWVLMEIYKNLRKYPVYKRAVAIILPRMEFVICNKVNIDIDEYKQILRDLIEDGLINIVESTENFRVIELDKSMFITNAQYYKEYGTDSLLCEGFFEPLVADIDEIEVEKVKKE